MSVFDCVTASLSEQLSKDLGSRIIELCAQINDEIIVFTDENLKLNFQGSLKSLMLLESQIRANEFEETNTTDDSNGTDSEFFSRKISANEAKELGMLQQSSKQLNREIKLPFLTCDVCSFKTRRPNHLNKHKLKHKNLTKLFSCDLCDHKCLRIQDLAKHKKQFHSESNGKQTSDPCFQRKSTANLKKQDAAPSVHTSESVNLHECKICSYKTIKASQITRHMSIHAKKPRVATPKDKSIHSCLECNYTTAKVSNFSRHLLTHSNIRKHLCVTCGLSFKRSDTLKQHLVVHGLESSKSCDICGKICRSQNHLNDHRATHSDLKNFLCHLCGVSFKTKATQLRHLRTVHDNPIIQKCFHCGQKVASVSSLMRHLRTFHAEKDINVALAINDVEEDAEEEPVIYTLDLTQDSSFVGNNLQYLIDDSEGSLIISHGTDEL